MTRLIDADALINSLNIRSVTYNCIINKCIVDAPTIDAVQVVRCKDCKHYSVEGDVTRFGYCNGVHEHDTDPNGFCHHGERSEP